MKQNYIKMTISRTQYKTDNLRPWRTNGKDNNDCIKPKLD